MRPPSTASSLSPAPHLHAEDSPVALLGRREDVSTFSAGSASQDTVGCLCPGREGRAHILLMPLVAAGCSLEEAIGEQPSGGLC